MTGVQTCALPISNEPLILQKYAPLKVVWVKEIVANARQTAVIDPEPAFAEALEKAGLHLKVRFAKPQYVVYLE